MLKSSSAYVSDSFSFRPKIKPIILLQQFSAMILHEKKPTYHLGDKFSFLKREVLPLL